ncbi:unnamed protein product [Prorocentrum cordatum]|uniref:Uncharacterized protein n=1 Tax=Prorocentrum cordatum TaxID=2364126 RepID=A0ABN9WDA0_9DINO|nr:unnamed protein product [Polarella glacialis]
MARLLVGHGAQLEAESASLVAGGQVVDEVAKVLLANSRLPSCARSQDWDGAMAAVGDGAWVDAFEQGTKRTALHWASIHGCAPAALRLANAGAGLEVRDADGWTAVHCALQSGHVEVVAALHFLGASLSARASRGDTLCHLAARADAGTMVQLLHAARCELSSTNAEGRAPLQVAAEGGCASVVAALVAFQADAGAKDDGGAPPSPWRRRRERRGRAALADAVPVAGAGLGRGAPRRARGQPARGRGARAPARAARAGGLRRGASRRQGPRGREEDDEQGQEGTEGQEEPEAHAEAHDLTRGSRPRGRRRPLPLGPPLERARPDALCRGLPGRAGRGPPPALEGEARGEAPVISVEAPALCPTSAAMPDVPEDAEAEADAQEAELAPSEETDLLDLPSEPLSPTTHASARSARTASSGGRKSRRISRRGSLVTDRASLKAPDSPEGSVALSGRSGRSPREEASLDLGATPVALLWWAAQDWRACGTLALRCSAGACRHVLLDSLVDS